jgi:hypothetical protein
LLIATFLSLTKLLLGSELCLIDFDNEHAGGTKPIKRTIVPYWKDAIGLGRVFCDTKSKKAIKGVMDSSMQNLSSTRGSHQAQWLKKKIKQW